MPQGGPRKVGQIVNLCEQINMKTSLNVLENAFYCSKKYQFKYLIPPIFEKKKFKKLTAVPFAEKRFEVSPNLT